MTKPFVPPHDLEVEQALLGALMQPSAPLGAVRAIVSTASFYRPVHGAIFEALCRLAERGDPAEPLLVVAELTTMGTAGIDAGGVVALRADGPAGSSAVRYAELLRDLADRRRAIALGVELVAAAQKGPLNGAVPRLQAQLVELTTSHPEPSPGESWAERDLSEVVQGLVDGTLSRPAPSLGRRSDGMCLFYPGRVNVLFGASGDGKTFVAQEVALQQIAEGHHVLWVDLEDDEVGSCSRLLDMGADPGAVVAFFHYFSPVEPFGGAARELFDGRVEELGPSLVVIDSAGEAMSLDGTESNSDGEVAAWMRMVPRHLAAQGPCVVVIDHTPKSGDGGLFAIGSQRKKAAVTGSSFLVEVIREFGVGREGRSKLTTAKDRLGTFVRGTRAAEFLLDATTVPYRAALEPPEQSSADGAFKPTHLMEKVSRWLEIHPHASKNAIEGARLGKAEYVRQATDLLVAGGHIRAERHGQAVRHDVITPYRETDEQVPEESF